MKFVALAFCLGLAGPLPPRVDAPERPRPGAVVPWEAEIRAAAGPYWVERAAQVWCESGWRRYAVSPVGAMGPVQVMPKTWGWWVDLGWVPRSSNPYDLSVCFVGQDKHMLWLRRYWQELDPRLAAYNAGQGPVLKAIRRSQEVGEDARNAWLVRLPRETQDYVRRNAERRAIIQRRLAGGAQ